MNATVMNTSDPQGIAPLPRPTPVPPGNFSPAVSWAAIAAGAAAAAALSLILLILGVGLGLSSISPWAREGVGATTLGVSTILWLTLTQLAAAAVGGYLAGRLRTRWVAVHTDEVYFRDTAHGFLAWALATLATAALLSSVIGAIVGGTVQAGAALGGGTVSAAVSAGAGREIGDGGSMGSTGYFVDSLFRRPVGAADAPGGTTDAAPAAAQLTEVARIFSTTLRSGALAPADQQYIGQLVAQRTGLSQADAEKRVGEIYARAQTELRNAEQAARAAADKARKASAYAALWLFISLLIGAFAASWAATWGGRQRDN